MKKLLLLSLLLLFAFGGLLSAQEVEAPPPIPVQEIPPPFLPPVQDVNPDTEFHFYKAFPWALGGAFELGRNARTDVATGYAVSLDRFMFTQYVALGLRGALHSDGNTISATEALLSLRVYKPVANNDIVIASLFAQWGFGYAFYTEEGREKNTYTMDVIAGARVYINEWPLRGFYLEPFFRTGYPFLLSGGIVIGHWFNFK
jgi:hypothetical protein